jgi:beta-lactamase class A
VNHRRTSPPLLLLVASILCASLFAPFTARGAAAEEPGQLADLQEQLQRAIDASGLDVTIAVTDLETGETAAVRGDEPRLTGCTINLLVLIQAALDMEAGRLAYEDADWLVRQIIYWSEPHRARQLVEIVGNGDVLNGILRIRYLVSRLGLATAVFDHPPAYDGDSISRLWGPPSDPDVVTEEGAIAYEPRPIDGESPEAPVNLISAADMNRLLGALWRNEILSPEWTDYLLDRMTRVSPGLQYLVGYARLNGAVVSHKNGYSWSPRGYSDNDAGIVRFSSGGSTHAYAVSYYADQLRRELGDVAVAQRLMRIIWNYFQERY